MKKITVLVLMLFTVLSNQVLSQENEQYQAILYYEIIDNNQSEALDTGDVINFILTATNTGNVGGDGGAYNYTFNDFDANQITLSDNSFVNGYQLEVGEQVESSASYSISEQSLSSGGVELEVDLFFGGYYFQSNKLRVVFNEELSADILLNGTVSAENNQIKNVADPTEAQDAVTLAYINQLEASVQDLQQNNESLQSQIDELRNLQNWEDNDQDGFTPLSGDCDDANASINPGATEIEDGIDNDCDGETDEGFMTEITLDFSTAFTFESDYINNNGATGMTGSPLDNSLFIAMRENSDERILKVNLATNNITEKIFDNNGYVTKRLHVKGNQLIAIGGQNVNTYNLDLSGSDPTSVSHGKTLTRFGMTVLDDSAYLIGGDFGAEPEAEKILSWNIETETLSEFSSLPETRFNSGGTIVDDNLYVFGGSTIFSGGPSSTAVYKVDINNPSSIETFQIEQAIDNAFVQRFQNLIYVAGKINTTDANNEITAVNPIVGVYNTLDNTYQELNTNLTNTSGLNTIHQMCIVNDKMYIIYGYQGVDNGGQFNEWEVLVSDLN